MKISKISYSFKGVYYYREKQKNVRQYNKK